MWATLQAMVGCVCESFETHSDARASNAASACTVAGARALSSYGMHLKSPPRRRRRGDPYATTALSNPRAQIMAIATLSLCYNNHNVFTGALRCAGQVHA